MNEEKWKMVGDGIMVLRKVIDSDLAEQCFRAARQVFDLPEERLEQFRSDGFRPGYTPGGVERVYGQADDRSKRRFWDVKDPDKYPGQFPCELPLMDLVMRKIFAELLLVGGSVLDEISNQLRQPREYLSARTIGGNHMLRLAYYPDGESGKVGGRKVGSDYSLRFPAHRDFGLLTMSLGGARPGLEIEVDGQWQQVEAEFGDVVVFGGTIMKMQSAGLVLAVRHRVVGGDGERIALVFFMEPRSDVVLANGERTDVYLSRLVRGVRT